MTSEIDPGLLLAAITLGLASLCALLYRRYGKPWFFWWAIAFTLYLGRVGAILTFLVTRHPFWLFAHQVATGWTALALLWSALVFSRRARFRRWYLLLVLFPPVWGVLAIYLFTERNQFLFAALPAVAFLSGATLWTAGVFFRFRRQTGSGGALALGLAFLLWGFHHLDYPILRAKGTWNPWGYYLDIIFLLAVGTGVLVLVLEDFERGLRVMGALSGDLQRSEAAPDAPAMLLGRALALPGVRGSALYDRERGAFLRGVGGCAGWEGRRPAPGTDAPIHLAVDQGRPVSVTGWVDPATATVHAFATVLPVEQSRRVSGAMVIVGDARDPFTALDESFLHALGRQVGAALENAELDRRLRRRTEDLERLSLRMVRQHEEERRRLSLELHDETAQVFSAVKLQLGVAREEVPPPQAERLGRVMDLVDEGMASIRNVTDQLRPSLLDDLGLLPALRALVADFESRTGIPVTFACPDEVPPLSEDAELALFRGVQEGLSNVARHAEAGSVTIRLTCEADALAVTLDDDGRGLGGAPPSEERMGLAGMRERFAAQGGRVVLTSRDGRGARLEFRLPIAPESTR